MNHFIIYATANEQSHRTDYYNFSLMAKYHPGVESIRLIVVVSIIDGSSGLDSKFISTAHKIFKGSWIKLEVILTKGNIGRDLSSVKAGLDELSNYAIPDDRILVRNRSSIGPFRENWFKEYFQLFDSKADVGLVGNTINLMYHPDIDPKRIAPHVQTYVYFSTYGILDKLRENFPGMNEVDRIKIICDGEIAISEKIMDMGYQIVSLFWPNEFIGKNASINEELPKKDIKMIATNSPFVHRYGLKGLLKHKFHISGWFGLMSSSLRRSVNSIQVKELDRFYKQ